MLEIQYAKNTYGPKCQNTHGPKLWLLDTWAWAHGAGRMGCCRRAAAAGPPPPREGTASAFGGLIAVEDCICWGFASATDQWERGEIFGGTHFKTK